MKRFGLFEMFLIVACAIALTYTITNLKVRHEVFAYDDYEYDTESFEKLFRVKTILDKKYLRNYDDEKLVEGAINGMLEAVGDPYTTYFNKEDSEQFLIETEGEYEGVEHGSSGWADGEQYEILNKHEGIILAKDHFLTTDNRFINKNVLIIGGAGSRKSRGYIMPNMMQMIGSYVVTDPKGENFDTAAGFFQQNGYEVRCINLANPECSDSYNPLWHIGGTLDVDIISDALIKGTSKGSTNEDPFWPQAERALLNSCIYYLLSECPKEEQSFASCLAMVRAGENFDWMDDVFMRLSFEHMARKSYETFRLAVDKTRAGVLVGLATRLNVFDTPEISSITGTSSIDIDAMGSKKMATFVITPDSHSAFNFISTIFFGQVLQRLYYKADENSAIRPDGKCTLDIPVFFLMDEFANVGQIPDFNQKLSTSRSRNINISIVLQSIDQLKIYIKIFMKILWLTVILIYS